MRLLVCGSRKWPDSFAVWQALTAMRPRPLAAVIHGAAQGADSFADGWAKTQGVLVLPFPADWKAHPRAAGPIRNARMLRDGRPDRGLAFGPLWREVRNDELEGPSPAIVTSRSLLAALVGPGKMWKATGTGDMVRRMLDGGLPVRWVAAPDAPAVDLVKMPEPGEGSGGT